MWVDPMDDPSLAAQQQHNPHTSRPRGRRILRLAQVIDRTGLSRSKIYKDMILGRFPRVVKLGAKSVGWIESEIDAYVDALIAARDAR